MGLKNCSKTSFFYFIKSHTSKQTFLKNYNTVLPSSLTRLNFSTSQTFQKLVSCDTNLCSTFFSFFFYYIFLHFETFQAATGRAIRFSNLHFVKLNCCSA